MKKFIDMDKETLERRKKITKGMHEMFLFARSGASEEEISKKVKEFYKIQDQA